MNSNSNIIIDELFDKVITHAFKSAYKYNRSLNGYIRDIGFSADTFNALRRQAIPKRGKFSLFLTLLTDYLTTNKINIHHGKRN